MKKLFYLFLSSIIVLVSACDDKPTAVETPLNNDLAFTLETIEIDTTSAIIRVSHNGTSTDTWYGFLSTDTVSQLSSLISAEVEGLKSFSTQSNNQTLITLNNLATQTKYRFIVFGLTAQGIVYGKANEISFTTLTPPVNEDDSVNTTEDEGELNYGEEGAAGDNIAKSDIIKGGTF